MAARSIASLTITFGLVSIPVKPYSAYDKAYFLAPDKGGPKPYALLSQAMYPAPAHSRACQRGVRPESRLGLAAARSPGPVSAPLRSLRQLP